MPAPPLVDPPYMPVPREISGPPVRGETGIGGLVPFGLTSGGPSAFGVGLAALWQNRDSLGYAWAILRHGVCDVCGLAPGEGVLPHVCTRRLRELRDHTRAALTPADVADVGRLRSLGDYELRALGRVPYPFVHRRGDRGFRRVTWDEALQLAGSALREASPSRTAWLAGTRGITNETYFAFAKTARLSGTNNVDLCAPAGHLADASGLGGALGWSAATCSSSDWIGTDLLLIWGSELTNHHPVSQRYLADAKRRGTRVVVIGPEGDGALAATWTPRDPVSAVFGARLTDDVVQVRPGGEVALVHAVLKRLLAWGAVDRGFIAEHTSGWADRVAALDAHELRDLAEDAGVSLGQVEWLAQLVARSGNMVSVGSMDAQKGASIAHLHLARGAIGKPLNGLMPIHEGSGRRSGGDCGVGPNVLPGPVSLDAVSAARFTAMWGHPVPTERGLDAAGALDAARSGGLDLLYDLGGELAVASPEPSFLREALGGVGLRIHQVTHLCPSVLVEGEVVLLLPAQTRYEQRGGGTSTSAERRIRFSPEILGRPVVGEARPAYEIPGMVACAARPELEAALRYRSSQAIRDEIGHVMPVYAGIERLTREGDQVQWGGAHLAVNGHFSNLPGGRARFVRP